MYEKKEKITKKIKLEGKNRIESQDEVILRVIITT